MLVTSAAPWGQSGGDLPLLNRFNKDELMAQRVSPSVMIRVVGKLSAGSCLLSFEERARPGAMLQLKAAVSNDPYAQRSARTTDGPSGAVYVLPRPTVGAVRI